MLIFVIQYVAVVAKFRVGHFWMGQLQTVCLDQEWEMYLSQVSQPNKGLLQILSQCVLELMVLEESHLGIIAAWTKEKHHSTSGHWSKWLFIFDSSFLFSLTRSGHSLSLRCTLKIQKKLSIWVNNIIMHLLNK